MSSTSFWTCPSYTRNHLGKKGAIFDIVEKEQVLHVLLLILGEGGSWLWLQLENRIEVSSAHFCLTCSKRDTNAEFLLIPLERDTYGLLLQVRPSLYTFVHRELWFTINWIAEKSIVSTCKMSSLRVNFLAASLPRIPGYMVLFRFIVFAASSTLGSLLVDDVVQDRESIQS